MNFIANCKYDCAQVNANVYCYRKNLKIATSEQIFLSLISLKSIKTALI